MKVTAPISILLASLAMLLSACTTPVAVDPVTATDEAPSAKYRFGNFYGPISSNAGNIFKVAIKEIDDMGYFRTGELHKTSSITIYARKVGDGKVSVRIKQIAPGESELRIRVGNGNLLESQRIYEQIRGAL